MNKTTDVNKPPLKQQILSLQFSLFRTNFNDKNHMNCKLFPKNVRINSRNLDPFASISLFKISRDIQQCLEFWRKIGKPRFLMIGGMSVFKKENFSCENS